MNESMYCYMKVGIVHFMAYPQTINGDGPILETVDEIAGDTYFNAIEVTWIKDKAIRKQVKRILDISHLTVAYGAQPRLLTQGLNINHLDNDNRLSALSCLIEGIDEAYEMNAKGFAFLSGNYTESLKEQSYKALVMSTKELCAYAEKKGDMKVILEIFDYDVDKRSLVGPAHLARRFAEEICCEYDNFGLMVDLSHLPLIGETVKQAIVPIKDYLVHAHIGNCVVSDVNAPGYGDLHPRFGFPEGENDVEEVAEFLRTLKDVGFLNTENPPIVSFEVKPFDNEEPKLIIANAKRTLNEAWAKV